MKKTIILLSALFLALLVPSILLNAQQGVILSDMFFVRKSADLYRANARNFIHLTRTGDETAFRICLYGEESSAALTWGEPILFPHEDISGQPEHYADTARIEYADGTVIEGRWNGERLTDPEGFPLWLNEGPTITIGDEIPTIGNYALADALCAMAVPDTEARGFAALPFLGSLIYILGALQFLFPEQMHFLFSRWRYQNAELSFDGILAEKLGAIVALLAGALLMYLPLFI